MLNILDYIKETGDITFEKSEFNEVDNLILARLSYFPLESIMTENETLTIKELYKRFKKKNKDELDIIWKADEELFPLIGESERFGELIVTKFSYVFDKETEEQFAAITVFLPDDTIYISYRGTDMSFVGWKEDFKLSYKNEIEAQLSGKKYLEEVAKEIPNSKIIIGGHSKGGNIGVFAAVKAKKAVKDRIIIVYNIEGPGFDEKTVNSHEYLEIIEKVESIIPQDSIIGRLMNHGEKMTIVKSTQKGIMQHDLYSWEIFENKIVRDKATRRSEFMDKTITTWLNNTSVQKRKLAIDTFFEILNNTSVEKFPELFKNQNDSLKDVLTNYKELDSSTKKVILKLAFQFIKTARGNLPEFLRKN